MNTITRIVAEDYVSGRALKMAMGHAAVVFKMGHAISAVLEYDRTGEPTDVDEGFGTIVIEVSADEDQ